MKTPSNSLVASAAPPSTVSSADERPVPPGRAQISAIIPVYNGARYLQHAIGSVVAQTVRPIELIVVDDGSVDGSAELVQELLGTALPFPVLLHRQPNRGQSAARNHGAHVANGEFLAFLDQDDLWYPRHLEALSALLLADTALGWAYSDVDLIDAGGGLVTLSYLATLKPQHPKHSLIQLLSEDMYILPSASLIRREAFQQIGGFDERLRGYEDDDLFLRLVRDGGRNSFLSEALSQWRIHPMSASYLPSMARSRDLYAPEALRTLPGRARAGAFLWP
jgi:glycosyltransferase involved in cell wall biosynthesis